MMVIIMIVSDQMIYNYLQLKIKRRNMWNMSEPVMLPTKKKEASALSRPAGCRMSPETSRFISANRKLFLRPKHPATGGPGETAMPCLAASRLGPLAKMWPN